MKIRSSFAIASAESKLSFQHETASLVPPHQGRGRNEKVVASLWAGLSWAGQDSTSDEFVGSLASLPRLKHNGGFSR